MLVRAKIQFEGIDNVTQPQKPHRESVRPVFGLCHGLDPEAWFPCHPRNTMDIQLSRVSVVGRNVQETHQGCQGAQSIAPKFPGRGSKICWCRMDRDRFEQSRSIPLAKRVSCSFKMKDAGSLLLVLKLEYMTILTVISMTLCDGFIHSNLSSITGYFEQTVPRCCPCDFKHHVWRLIEVFQSNDEKNIANSFRK